jgi:hypothetical protein
VVDHLLCKCEVLSSTYKKKRSIKVEGMGKGGKGEGWRVRKEKEREGRKEERKELEAVGESSQGSLDVYSFKAFQQQCV